MKAGMQSTVNPAALCLELAAHDAVLEPALRDLAITWSTARRRRLAKVYARWAAQLLESAELFDDLGRACAGALVKRGVAVELPEDN